MARKKKEPRRGFGAIRQLPSGRHQASYIGPDGARHRSPITYATKTDAEYWLLDERRYLDRVGLDAWQTPARRAAAADPDLGPTLREYSTDWIRHKVATKDLRQSTAEKYHQALRLRILDRDGEPALGDLRLEEVTPRQVAAWWRKLDHEHERACDLAYQVLRAMMNQAVADELITENPCRVKGAGASSKRRSIDPLTPAQVQAVADKMTPERWRIAVHLGAWCALRSGEVRELRRGDFDLNAERPVVRVRRGVVRLATGLEVGDVKTDAGSRDVLIPAPLVPLLKAHLKAYVATGADALLLTTDGGGQVDDRNFRRSWSRAFRGAGHKGSRFHDLRHVGLTYSAVAGATVRELQQIAGHTTPTMAMRYQEVAASHLGDVVDRLGTIIGGTSE